MAWTEIVTTAGPYLFGGGGCVAVLKVWIDGRRVRGDLVHIAQEAAGAVIADLRHETQRLRQRLEEVEAEFATFRKAHDTMIADKDAELALLRGENRQLRAIVESYERLLTEHAIPHKPPLVQDIWQVSIHDARPLEMPGVDPNAAPVGADDRPSGR